MTGAATASYLHATALVLGERGVLLRGPSGAGKSALALALIAHFEARGDFARLVGDDRVHVEALDGRLVARPHPAIAGLVEARGLGLSPAPSEPACVLHAIVDLSPRGEAPPRYPCEEEKTAELHEIALLRLAAEGCSDASVARIAFFLQGITTI